MTTTTTASNQATETTTTAKQLVFQHSYLCPGMEQSTKNCGCVYIWCHIFSVTKDVAAACQVTIF